MVTPGGAPLTDQENFPDPPVADMVTGPYDWFTAPGGSDVVVMDGAEYTLTE
jgi:hypothetical protein